MKKVEILVLFLVILGGFLVRLYRFDNPILDWHSWRQADTSAVSRNFVKYGFDVLHPRFDDLSNVSSGIDNPQGYRFVEFPIYNIAQAGLYKVFGNFTLEQWGRLVSIFSSLASAFFIYLIVKKYQSKFAGIFSMFFFLFIPYSIYYSRTILPDTSMVMAILGGIYFFDRWISSDVILRPKAEESRRGSFTSFRMTALYILAIVFVASALLLKPYALFFTLPMVYLVWKHFGFSLMRKWQLWLFLALSISPLVLWRIWMNQYPEGIPANAWLFNEGNIRFKGAFFYWIFADRISKLILGYWGVILLAMGFLFKIKKENSLFFLSFAASSLLYLIIIARGNVQHDYYQILILPTICIFLGIGSEFVLKRSKDYFNRISSITIFVVSVAFMLAFGWYNIRDYFNINNSSLIVAGKAVDFLTPKDAKIIAPYDGDTSFLYQTNRQGWASFEKSLPEMAKIADYLVLANTAPNDYDIGKTYRITAATKEFILFSLKEKP